MELLEEDINEIISVFTAEIEFLEKYESEIPYISMLIHFRLVELYSIVENLKNE